MAALSRTPSPAAGSGSDSDSAVATPLTPRTKLRELFATIGGGNASSSSGSDHERESNEENKTPSRKAKKTSAKLSARKSPRLADTSTFARVQTAAASTTSPLQTRSASRSPRAAPLLVGAGALPGSSDEDSDIEVRPRGRFAARMQVAAAADSTAAAEPLADNARDRVKRMLQQAAEAEKPQEEGGSESVAKSHEDTTNDAEDEEDAPVVARPRKRLTNLRTARRSASASPRQSATPSRSTREDSPPMFMTPSKQSEREDSPDMFMTPEKGGDDDNGAAAPGRKARFQAIVARKREEARAREEAEEKKRAARLAAMADNSDNDDDDEVMGGLDEDDDLLMRDAEGADDNPSDITDDEGGRRLTQKMAGARPERKASKKALEEMHRETQRMARNLQLAHEAKTRKKITKASLFERFNFHPTGPAAAASSAAPAATSAKEPASSSRPTSPASPHNNTDTEMRANADTPPSSPPVPVMPNSLSDKAKEAMVATTVESANVAVTLPQLDKGKGKAVETFVVDEQPKPELKRNIRVRMPIVQTNLVMIDSDDDGELEIVQTAKNKLDILFDSVPLKRNQEPHSMFALRRLAQIGSPGKKPRARLTTKGAKHGGGAATDLTLSELQQSLQDRARRQAKLEREERLDMLRAKGVRIQTEEEREREMEEVDDIVARARQEAEELMQRERDEAKKEKKGDGADAVPDVLDWDESEDEDDYVPEEEEEVEEREIELSGSEDEEDENDGDEEVLAGILIDGEAESTDNDSEDGKDEEEDTSNAAEVLPTPTRPRPAKRRAALIISDDEDEGEDNNNTPATAKPLSLAFEAKTPGPKTAFAKSPSGLAANNDSPQVPTSVLRSATKSFIPGLPVAVGDPAGLGLTQIFAGTMADDSQMAGSQGGFGSPSQFMPTLGNFVDADFSQAAANVFGDKTNAAAVLDSQQTQEWIKRLPGGGGNATDSNNGGTGPSQMVQFNFSQSQAHGLKSLLREPDVSQMSLLGPSQDAGPQDYTPLKMRFIEHQPSAIETVILGDATQQPTQPLTQSQAQSQLPIPSPSPVAPRRPRGRLFRKTDVAKIVEEEEEEEAADAENKEEEAEPTDEQVMEAATAFAKMRQAALQKQFDRKKSKAKEMVEEQAEESEDEYAGLGGADGEDSDNESLASVKDIIDDDQKVSSTDNAKLAAFYADRERENDEKQVEKLFRDVTTGMLRRKRGAGGAGDYDLSDSDDGGEARRRMKRRQFARMQKALFSDERVSKVAENPRNQAFLRTIEDRGSDDEMDFIFDGAAEHPAAPATSATASTASTASPAVPAADATISIPDSQPSAAVGAPAPPTTEQQQQQQSHPRRRRLSVNPGKKPANLGEIRESLSSLLEDYHNDGSNLSIVADSEFGSDGEGDEEDGDKENQPVAAVAPVPSVVRRLGRNHNVQVVDRISLKRNHSNMSSASVSSADSSSSSSVSTIGGGGSSMGMGPTGFRVPALLRRATTNSLVSNGSSSSSSANANKMGADKAGGNAPDNGKIKKNASKMSGIHYFARENERRAAMAESDKRRQAKKAKNAEGRARAVGGLFGAGKFE